MPQILDINNGGCFGFNGFQVWQSSRSKPPAFKFEIKTTTASESFTLPLTAVGVYGFNVDWGDGSTDDITTYSDPAVTHTYAVAGAYDITITGQIEGWQFGDSASAPKLYQVYSWGDLLVSPDGSQFYGCKNMTWVGAAVGGCVTGHTHSMYRMFQNCAVFNSSLARFDTNNVYGMLFTFAGCYDFDQSITHFVVDNVNNMIDMFYAATLSTANYDALLISWSPQVPAGAYLFHGGNSKYTPGGAAEAARTAWIAKGWSITDSGPAT